MNGSEDIHGCSVCVCMCVCVTVSVFAETDGKVWVTTRGHDTSWHTVGLPPASLIPQLPPSSIFHPDFFLSPLFPLFLHLSRVCVHLCVCVLGWRGWTSCDTWQRWAQIRDVPVGGSGSGGRWEIRGEGYCIYSLSSWDLIKLTLHGPLPPDTHTHICIHTFQ